MVPLPAARSEKPRRSGLTMIVDAGTPLGQQEDLMDLAADYVDLAKIKTGSARVYSEPSLRKKLQDYRRHRVQPFLGGQIHEYVFATQGCSRSLALRISGDRTLTAVQLGNGGAVHRRLPHWL